MNRTIHDFDLFILNLNVFTVYNKLTFKRNKAYFGLLQSIHNNQVWISLCFINNKVDTL